MTWLVVGGAGYIGGHVVHRLREEGRALVVMDDLSTGIPERVPADVPLVVASTANRRVVQNTIRDHRVTGVVYLAGRKSAPESVAHPLSYHRSNVEPLRMLLEEMGKAEVHSIVFSSSAAVYGIPESPLVDEQSRTAPINPYGETKLVGEWLLRSVGVACGLSWIALRYFNVIGTAAPELADRMGTSLVPSVFRSAMAGRPFRVTGSDYPTRDGTGVRDYVHVLDVADAHVAAVRRLGQGREAELYNVGTGRGYSVLEIVAEVRKVTGLPVEVSRVDRRPCDPAEVVASVEKIRRELGWQARHDLSDMVRSTWQSLTNPKGVVHAG